MLRITCWFTVAVVLAGVAGCGGKAVAKKPTWRTDAAPLQQMLPFLGKVTTCSWCTGIEQDRSGGVPGPDAVYLRGYVILSPEDEQRLQSTYKWQPEQGLSVNNLEMPPDGPAIAGPVLASPELIRSLPSLCTYHQGKIYFLPQSHIVYFNVIKD